MLLNLCARRARANDSAQPPCGSSKTDHVISFSQMVVAVLHASCVMRPDPPVPFRCVLDFPAGTVYKTKVINAAPKMEAKQATRAKQFIFTNNENYETHDPFRRSATLLACFRYLTLWKADRPSSFFVSGSERYCIL